jgi:hypothetical protein
MEVPLFAGWTNDFLTPFAVNLKTALTWALETGVPFRFKIYPSGHQLLWPVQCPEGIYGQGTTGADFQTTEQTSPDHAH